MAKFDIENLLDAVTTFLKANLNTKIAAINSEKNDSITLGAVNSGAYHFQYPQDRADANDPIIVVEEAEEPRIATSGGALVAVVHHVGVTVILADSGIDPNIVRKLFRYRRALTDLFQENWANVIGSHKFELHAWSPTIPFKHMESGETARFVGVVLVVPIAY